MELYAKTKYCYEVGS